ncbi:MAG: VOC family protein [Parvibaculum sp.]|uniref:VOC family protein n=1 Tax=Parvibaculum sp. TaxID=2024848 RepID=UPI0025E5FCFA|nr:VOC family protein [Parvibaculum sp.]MCE9650287.1 VOC family protein [Parvibaculum sp.]
MRLRQIALVAGELEPIVAQLESVLGLKVAYRDPGVAIFGLVNAVFPVGGEFLEVVQPVRDDASAARYLKRRGGDAGYMVIMQARDALSHRARMEKLGIRKIAEHQDKKYTFTHFHPGDFNGVLTSIDSVGGVADYLETEGDWPPAGRDWRNAKAAANIVGLTSVTIQDRNPEAAAKRWGELLEAPVEDGDVVRLTKGAIKFVPPVDADGTGVVAIDVAVKDAATVLAAAKAQGLAVKGASFDVCGIAVNLVKG